MKSSHLGLPLTAAYGMFNANDRWQNKSNEVLFGLGLRQCQQVPQIFFKHVNGQIVLFAAKSVDEILAAGSSDATKWFIDAFNDNLILGTVKEGSGKMRFFGIYTNQEQEKTIATDDDEKLNALTEYFMSRSKRNFFQ